MAGGSGGRAGCDPPAHGAGLHLAFSFLGESGRPRPTAVEHDAARWERAIEFWLNGNLSYTEARSVFIHRDYHPTNVLWRGGAVSGVVDWINACQGPAGVDVAHCRTNLVQMYGPEAADQFLNAYHDVSDGFVYNPYWDVDSVLDMCLPQPTYYEPWKHFGLGAIALDVMRQRVDAYLERVMMRT